MRGQKEKEKLKQQKQKVWSTVVAHVEFFFLCVCASLSLLISEAILLYIDIWWYFIRISVVISVGDPKERNAWTQK